MAYFNNAELQRFKHGMAQEICKGVLLFGGTCMGIEFYIEKCVEIFVDEILTSIVNAFSSYLLS